jgi:hypothetical protein
LTGAKRVRGTTTAPAWSKHSMAAAAAAAEPAAADSDRWSQVWGQGVAGDHYCLGTVKALDGCSSSGSSSSRQCV